MKAWLLDTGPLVAYLNVKDRLHTEVAHCLDAFSGQLHTTSAVITEAMHFVAVSSNEFENRADQAQTADGTASPVCTFQSPA